jgi:myo-inositol-1(or 4)-monophosphatase
MVEPSPRAGWLPFVPEPRSVEKQWHDWMSQAREAAHCAGELIRNNLGRATHVEYKSHNNPVTEVDLQCQAVISEYLLRRNPEHGFLGEEGSPSGIDNEYLWIVDPIDGTVNFSHGYPFVSVSIALEHRGQVILGLIYDPTRDETFEALRGGGARLDGSAIHVSEQEALDKSLLVTGFAGATEIDHELFLSFSRKASGVRRDGSAALDLCYVACGRLDGFFELNLSPWDVAAGSLIVEEAQGMLTDFSGRPFRVRGRQVVASNVRLHKQMLDVLQGRAADVDRLYPHE